MINEKIIGSVIGACLLAVGAYSWKIGHEVQAKANQQMQSEVIRHAYEGARGYDVRLDKLSGDFGVGGVLFGVGTLEGRGFEGPAIIARDYDEDGIVDEYHCIARYSGKGHWSPFGRFDLWKECHADSDVMKLANPGMLSRIERELLPYYGQNQH